MKAAAILCGLALATASPLIAERQAASSTIDVASATSLASQSFPSAAETSVADPFEDLMDALDSMPPIAIVTGGNGANTVVTSIYDPDAVAAQAAADILQTADDEEDTLTERDLGLDRRGSCNPEPLGNAPTVSPDTPDAFLANTNFSTAATSAVTPLGYFAVDGWTNLHASAQATHLLATISSVLSSYNVSQCAAYCTAKAGCVSFNIFFERDPSIFYDSKNCPNPPSYTRIKCTFWGVPLTTSLATNVKQGGKNGVFETVIAGSNAYTTLPQPLVGFSGPVSLGNATIEAPTADKTYMGVYTYVTPYDPNVCATVCNSVSAYNTRHPSATGPRICQFFDAFMAYTNGANGVLTCTLYTEAYDTTYAKNFGQTRSGTFYGFGHSYTYTLDSN